MNVTKSKTLKITTRHKEGVFKKISVSTIPQPSLTSPDGQKTVFFTTQDDAGKKTHFYAVFKKGTAITKQIEYYIGPTNKYAGANFSPASNLGIVFGGTAPSASNTDNTFAVINLVGNNWKTHYHYVDFDKSGYNHLPEIWASVDEALCIIADTNVSGTPNRTMCIINYFFGTNRASEDFEGELTKAELKYESGKPAVYVVFKNGSNPEITKKYFL
jgi:hypothetical protein